MENSTYTLTSIVECAKEKAKKVLYLVLIKKPLSVKALEKINKKIELKLNKFLDKIIPKLEKIKPKEKEKFLKYMMLKATLNILDKIMKENYMELSEKDKITAKNIFENSNKDFNEAEKEDEKNMVED
jgi:hypothetical protein